MKTDIVIINDYYKIIKTIDSCEKFIQLKSCVKIIEFFVNKHLHKVDLSFKGIEKYHNVNKRYEELKSFYKRKKLSLTKSKCLCKKS